MVDIYTNKGQVLLQIQQQQQQQQQQRINSNLTEGSVATIKVKQLIRITISIKVEEMVPIILKK